MSRLGLVAASAALAACAPSPVPPPGRGRALPPAAIAAERYQATIHWTAHGVPHIVAADLGGLGFGQGYAQGQARLCEIADGIVRVRGERARYLGRGPQDAHVTSDLANLHLGYRARAEAMLPSLSAETRAMLAGYAAGYNLALARRAPAARPPACRDAPWLVSITAADVAAYGLSLASLASSHFLEGAIAGATPGGGPTAACTDPAAARCPVAPAPRAGACTDPASARCPVAPAPRAARGASNAWSIGADRTASGGGILIGNPHFPWEGDLLFHEAHLVIPGDLDVYGVALAGTPGIQIGTTPHHAWSHTFSASTHMVVYRIELSAHSALRYRHGDQTLPIVAATYEIAVRGDDGQVATERHTRYRSAVGPMMATPMSPWEGPGGHAFTVHDVGAGGGFALDEYLALARAQTRADFEAALALHGTPFVNTIYADAAGDALYVDGSRVPALSDEAIAGWRFLRRVLPPLEAAWQQGLVVVDGSDPIYDLATDDPRAPGAVPFAAVPRVVRRDFVINANDSFRFTHLDQPEVAVPAAPLWGGDAPPSTRTLENLALLAPGAGTAGPDDRFTLDEAIAALLSSRSFSAARLRDDFLAACPGATPTRPPPRRRAPRPRPPPVPTAPDPLPAACAALAAWDGRFTVDSRGAALWREALRALTAGGPIPWARAFDRQAPHLTPDGLARTPAQLRAALAAGAAALAAAGWPPDVALGAVQTTTVRDLAVAVPGGDGVDGVANVTTWNQFDATALPRAAAVGRYPVNYGASFVLAVELVPGGRTVRALLTYGNSSDPASPWYRDQLDAFARAELRPVPLTDAAIAADPDHRVEEIRSP